MGGGDDMYRHTITTKLASRQQNLPNACRTKDNLDNAGNNAATSVEIRYDLKKMMKCRILVAISSTLCFSTATRYTRNNIFISLFAHCRHLRRLRELYSQNMVYLRNLRLCPASPVFQCGNLDSIPASTSQSG